MLGFVLYSLCALVFVLLARDGMEAQMQEQLDELVRTVETVIGDLDR